MKNYRYRLLKILSVSTAMIITAVSASSCRNNTDKNSGLGAGSVAASESQQNAAGTDGNVKIKSYRFPEFMEDMTNADVLSNVIYTSFDSASLMVEPEKQPFDGYKCTACFNGEYYIFKEDENYGLLNSVGEIIIPADGVSRISAASDHLLQVKYDDGTTGYYRTADDFAYPETIAEFDVTRISFAPHEPAESGGGETYTLRLDGYDIYETQFSSVSPVEISNLDTSKKGEAAYRASAGSSNYYIVFDKFYNFTVYEAEYGFISLKIGGRYGECYILGSDDFAELETLISSFGRESSVKAPGKDENGDYIQITMGAEGDPQKVITVSADGYCLTDNRTIEPGEGGKYFSVMNSETFIDLVNWVDTALSVEYLK